MLLINSLGTGGAEKAVKMAAVRLRHLERDVRILCLERSIEEGERTTECQVEYLSNMRTSSSAILKLVALPILGFRLALYLARFHIPVVMSHLFRANFVNVLARVLAGSRHRTILVNHTRLSRLSGEGIQGRISLALCHLLYPKADLVASVSTGATRECARLLGLPEAKLVTLYDPIDTLASEVADSGKRSHSILAVGRLVALKRFQDLIEAFARISLDFPMLRLDFVGDGPERTRLQRLAAEAGILNHIRFWGLQQKPAKALEECEIFVSTSATEGFGMAIVEALAAGVPVIASDCAYGPREILSPATDPVKLLGPGSEIELAPFGVLYPVGSVRALERALRLLLGDSRLQRDLARKGRARAADFSIERSTAAYEKLLFA